MTATMTAVLVRPCTTSTTRPSQPWYPMLPIPSAATSTPNAPAGHRKRVAIQIPTAT